MNRENNHNNEKPATTPGIIYGLDKDNPFCENISDILWDDKLSDTERRMSLAKALADACGEGFGINKPINNENTLQSATHPTDAMEAQENDFTPPTTDEEIPFYSYPEGINPVIIWASLYYEHGAFLQRLINAVRSPSGMSQIIMFNERVTIHPYKNRHFEIKIKGRNLEMVFYKQKPRAGSFASIKNMQKQTTEKIGKITG